MQVSESLVRNCLYNWIGYGKLNSSVWIVGVEEGYLEISSGAQTLQTSLEIRSKFSLTMDFKEVWSEEFKVTSLNTSNPWKFAARFLLGLNNQPFDEIQHFIDKSLGRKWSDHFFGDFLPLPKKGRRCIEGYRHIWTSVSKYWDDVADKRWKLIFKQMGKANKLRLLITYDSHFTDYVKRISSYKKLDSWNENKFEIGTFIIDSRPIIFLSTPFWGVGHMKIASVNECISRIQHFLK